MADVVALAAAADEHACARLQTLRADQAQAQQALRFATWVQRQLLRAGGDGGGDDGAEGGEGERGRTGGEGGGGEGGGGEGGGGTGGRDGGGGSFGPGGVGGGEGGAGGGGLHVEESPAKSRLRPVGIIPPQ